LENINADLDAIIYVDEIKVFLMFFADDVVVFSQNPETLQSLIDDISRYCSQWGLTLNTRKTKVIIFENGTPSNYIFYINSSQIELVHSFKYLGVYQQLD